MNKIFDERDPCGICSFFGMYVPWALIVVGGIMGALPFFEPMAETSAWFVALGLAMLTASVLLGAIRDNGHTS